MNWFGWTLVSLLVIDIIARIALIGKDRKPYTPTQAVISFVFDALLICGIIFVK